MIHTKLFDNQGHSWTMFGRDPSVSKEVIDTNEYLIVSGEDVLMMDPGGTEIFPNVVAAVSKVIDVGKITHFFCSHQDPDIMSSLPLWLGLCPQAKIYLPWMWSGFIAHFGHEYVSNFIKVPDEGMTIPLKDRTPLQLIPAHYCHSPGNFSLYDPSARILFSGDIGAALLPEDTTDIEVTDFQTHIRYMEGFHRRWMPSNQALRRWVQRVRLLDVHQLCPQHGSVFRGENIQKFLNWLEKLEVGSAI